MNELIKKISNLGIVPVIKIDNVETAVPLAEALINAGLPVAEVTFRTAQAEESIKRIVKAYPDMLVGAGTVLSIEQVDKAVNAGAKFIVSPGFNPKVVSYCISNGITIIPGTSSPSDMEAALEMGLDVVKFFPAEQSGGVEYLKAVGGPYTTLKFIPTGGINAKNLNSYLAQKNVIACGGSWMVKSDLIDAGDFDTITKLTREAIQNMLGFSLDHVGINCADLNEADSVTNQLSSIFGFEYKMGNSSIFAGEAVEVMKSPFLGQKGHIAIKTNSIDRAVAYLSEMGVTFNESTRKIGPKGETKAIYLSEEIGGFAIHLKN
ncbi:MAG: bifunctional 4-hydroxy-2-oxoglutarate aldolase/2-dehydro-3-deoxy-phosphogluconate aldolase [Sedimentibacter sp.]